MRRFIFGLVPGAVFGAFVALGAQTLAPPSFEAFVGGIARSLAELRAPVDGTEEDPAGVAARVSDALPAPASELPSSSDSEERAEPVVASGAAVVPASGDSEVEAVAPTSSGAVPVARDDELTELVDAVAAAPAAPALPEAFADDYAWWGRVAGGEGGDAPADGRGMRSAEAALAGPGDDVEAARSIEASGAPSPSADTAAALASVWIPFRSERSATGFAQRLTRALERPFSVERQGAGRYQVVFAYADVDERDEVFARVAQITGEGS